MEIYLVRRTDDIGYDEYTEKVVCAENEQQAREWAAKWFADEGKDIWFDKRTEVLKVKTDKAMVISESFRAD